MSCYCDYEMPEFFIERMRTARKKHLCDECYGEIKSGSKYKAIAGKWDGQFSEYKQCEQCLGLIDFMDAHTKCWCWYYGGVINSALEEVQNWGSEARSVLFHVYRHVVRRKNARLAKASHD